MTTLISSNFTRSCCVSQQARLELELLRRAFGSLDGGPWQYSPDCDSDVAFGPGCHLRSLFSREVQAEAPLQGGRRGRKALPVDLGAAFFERKHDDVAVRSDL